MNQHTDGPTVKPICAKCGHCDVLIRWHGPGAYHHSRKYQPCWGDYGQTRGKPEEEHLHYRCHTCQYDWAGPLTPELPLPNHSVNAPRGAESNGAPE